MAPVEYLGLFAGLFTTFALIPQIMRVYKLKHAHDISLVFNSTMLVGIFLWLFYGIFKGLISIIAWNIVGALLNGWLLILKFKYGKEKV